MENQKTSKLLIIILAIFWLVQLPVDLVFKGVIALLKAIIKGIMGLFNALFSAIGSAFK